MIGCAALLIVEKGSGIILVQGLGRNAFSGQQLEVIQENVRVSNCGWKGQVIFSRLSLNDSASKGN